MRKGQKMSDVGKAKISLAHIGKRVCMRTEYKRGNIPFNKGTKGLMKANKTSFKKGQIPANYRGGYKICKDGIYVKVGNKKYSYQKNGKQIIVGKYEQLARRKYREKFGDFPKEMIIFHKDSDVYNNEIDNLELISRAELLKRNSKKIKKICETCKEEFWARNNYVKNCSLKCIKEYNNKIGREYSKTHREIMNKKQREYKQRLREKQDKN